MLFFYIDAVGYLRVFVNFGNFNRVIILFYSLELSASGESDGEIIMCSGFGFYTFRISVCYVWIILFIYNMMLIYV